MLRRLGVVVVSAMLALAGVAEAAGAPTPVAVGKAGQTAFEFVGQDLAYVGGRRFEHVGAAVGLDRDEAVALEADERLPHRRLGDPELAGDARLDELLTRPQDAGDDLVPQPLVDSALELGRQDLLAHGLRHRLVHRISCLLAPRSPFGGCLTLDSRRA